MEAQQFTIQEKDSEWITEPVKNHRQYIAAVSVTLFVFAAGAVMGWTSPTLPLLRKENSTLSLTEDQEKWVGSLMPMSAVIGPLPGGILADVIGRKKSMLAVGVLLLSSWGVLAAAQSVWYLYVGRLIAGFALGWGMTVQPMYLGEIATPEVRVLGQIQICLGFLWVYTIGAFVSYLWLCILCALIAIAFFSTFILMPESPYFLILKNDLKGATKALKWLRGRSTNGIKKELNILQMEVEQTVQNKGTWTEAFLNYGNRKAILVIFFLMAVQQFSGINAVLFYSETIFEKAGSRLSPSSCSIAVAFVMTVASIFVPYLVEKMGRRPLTVISAFSMGLSLMCMGIYFYLDHDKVDVTNLSWLPLGAMILFIMTYSVGVGPIPWLMIGEVFAPNIRAHSAAISSAFSWIIAFIVTNSFGGVMAIIGAYGVFWVFSVASITGAVIGWFFIPETKGKTLQEIQVLLNKK